LWKAKRRNGACNGTSCSTTSALAAIPASSTNGPWCSGVVSSLFSNP
jgi:hypothetical protein